MKLSLSRIVFLQWTTAVLLFVVLTTWGWIFGTENRVAISFLLGASCSLVPNSLFALHLWAHARANKVRRRIPSPSFFFAIEFLKICMTLLLMVIAVRWYHDLAWLPFLLGLVVVLKSYLLTLFWLK